VSFTSGPEAYDRFMGRYSIPLAATFAAFVDVQAPERVLDVGCGPGALTGELVDRFGAEAVWAVDPEEQFVRAVGARHPGVRVHRAAAEAMPFADRLFDGVLAQLVIPFLADPLAGLREMRRTTATGGVVAACVWDHAGGGSPLDAFWKAARRIDPGAPDESRQPGARQGDLAELFRAAGFHDVDETLLAVTVEHPSFEDWWEPYTLGVGPAGGYLARLDPGAQVRLREACRASAPAGPFTVSAAAWAARGYAGMGTTERHDRR
jgi:SAM-dependent methyltransferase